MQRKSVLDAPSKLDPARGKEEEGLEDGGGVPASRGRGGREGEREEGRRKKRGGWGLWWSPGVAGPAKGGGVGSVVVAPRERGRGVRAGCRGREEREESCGGSGVVWCRRCRRRRRRRSKERQGGSGAHEVEEIERQSE